MSMIAYSRGISVLLLLLPNILTTACQAQPAQSPQEVRKQPPLAAEYVRLQNLLREGDLSALEAAAAEFRAKRKRNTQGRGIYGQDRYAQYLLDVIGTMGKYSVERRRAQALLLLGDAEELPLEIELRVLGYLGTGPAAFAATHAPPSESWPEQRRTDARWWLHGYKRLRDGIDPSWDPNYIDFVSPSCIAPPSGYTGLWMGPIDPKAIKDPEMRAEYEATIAENSRRTQRYQRQVQLRKLRDQWTPGMEIALIQAYIAPPEALPELKALLDEYKVDEETRARILHGVQTKTVPQRVIPSTQPSAPGK